MPSGSRLPLVDRFGRDNVAVELIHELDPLADEGREYAALLRRSGKPYQLSPGQLVHETLVTSGTMTNRVDRLVTRGLVERLPDPGDRRGVQVRLTTAGRKAVDGALDALLAHEYDLLAGLSPAEATSLANALRVLSLPFDAH